MKEYSEIFRWYYDIESGVSILNLKQQCFYVSKAIPLMDMYYSGDSLVMVFDKQASKEAYKEWCSHELNWGNNDGTK